MRWPQDSAITRRDEQLARTRRLTTWIASAATISSLGLAAALGFALPGHAANASAGSSRQAGSGSSGTAGSGSQRQGSVGQGSAHRHRRLAPPHHAPANSGGAPVVSSGGS
jgi:hypothetical protein